MWRRFRNKSLAPRRPAVFAEQAGIVMVSAGLIVAGLVVVALSVRW